MILAKPSAVIPHQADYIFEEYKSYGISDIQLHSPEEIP